MLRPITYATLLAMPALVASVWAAPMAVTLSVPGMTCSLCPLTIKKALSRVGGVSSVAVNFDKREATVVFDDATTDVDALRKATANAGYPSTLKRY